MSVDLFAFMTMNIPFHKPFITDDEINEVVDSLKRITLAPPLARAIAPYSVILCQILEKIPLLCTHYLGIIKKRS